MSCKVDICIPYLLSPASTSFLVPVTIPPIISSLFIILNFSSNWESFDVQITHCFFLKIAMNFVALDLEYLLAFISIIYD